jgi:hypothetical protein
MLQIKKISFGDKMRARLGCYIVVICMVILRWQMTTGKMAKMRGFGV